jgi:hypothetical protein
MTKYNKYPSFTHGIVAFLVSVGDGTPRKLATATQLQFPRNTAEFKQATGFQICRRTLRKFTFD